MANGTDLRRIALGLDGTIEAPHMDRAAFKVARIYATLASDGRTANLKLAPEEQEFHTLLRPEAVSRIPNAWGAMGWTCVRLEAVDGDALTVLLETAWRHALPRPKTRKGPAR